MPWKYSDVMRQTRKYVDNVSLQTESDQCDENEAKEVVTSDDGIGTTRFLILSSRLPEGVL